MAPDGQPGKDKKDGEKVSSFLNSIPLFIPFLNSPRDLRRAGYRTGVVLIYWSLSMGVQRRIVLTELSLLPLLPSRSFVSHRRRRRRSGSLLFLLELGGRRRRDPTLEFDCHPFIRRRGVDSSC